MPKEKPKQTTLDERFITEIDGNKFIQLAGLIDLGHKRGLSKIEVDIVQLPSSDNENFAVCKCVVVSKDGALLCSDVGDASPANTNSRVSKHLLRIASSRAIGRALRSYTNAGFTCLDELSDINEVLNAGGSNKNNLVKIKKAKLKTTKPASAVYPVSAAQVRAISSIAKKRNMSEEEMNKLVEGNYGTTFEKLSTTQASSLISMLQKSA